MEAYNRPFSKAQRRIWARSGRPYEDLSSFSPTVLLQLCREQGERKIYLFLALPLATKLQVQDRKSDKKATDAEDDLHGVQEKGETPEDQGRTLRRGKVRSEIRPPTFRGRNHGSTDGATHPCQLPATKDEPSCPGD